MNRTFRRMRNLKQTSTLIMSQILTQLEKLVDEDEEAKNTDTQLFFSKPGRAIWANFVIGISRGVGFVLGVSILGVIITAIFGWLLSKFVTIPIIGEFIAMIVQSVQEFLKAK